MTTTLVFGDASDGYLSSFDASYATARTGPADAVTSGNTAYYGQNNNGGSYAVFQAFVRFAYPALAAGEKVASAVIRLSQTAQLSTGVSRDMEVRGFAWSGSGLTTGDWRTPTQLSALTTYATVRGVQASNGKATFAGSDALRAAVEAGTSFEAVVVSSRQRAGSTPTTDEGSAFATADTSGTAQDPCLIFTTVVDTVFTPGGGAEVQLSDGTWAFVVRADVSSGGGGPVAALYREDLAGVAAKLGEVPLGTGSSEWLRVPAAQGMALAVDSADNLYVVGRAGDAPNSIRHCAFVKAPGSWTWTAGTTRTIPLPAHDAPINNIVACWHPTAGGTLAVFAAHAAGDGVSGGYANDLAFVLINSQYLLDGTGTQLRASGSAVSAGLTSASLPSTDFSGYTNESGSGLDVVADRVQPDWGYLASFRRGQGVGANATVTVGRYILNSTGTGLSHASFQASAAYGVKDASAKLRLLAVGSGLVTLVTADADAGQGITVEALQATGTTPGFVGLGVVPLAGESITNHPDGPAIATSPAWDAVYNSTENAVWIYYVDTTDPLKLRRTSVSLDTYQATRVSVLAYTSTADILAVRVPRNGRATQTGHATLAVPLGGYRRVLDTFNQPPLTPTLAARANYDATTDAPFSWVFNDPNAGDTQSAYQLQVQRVDTGATALDTGKVASATPSRNVVGGTLANGLDYRWRVMTWDALDTASPWSAWGTFTTSAAGSVNITDPAVDNPPDVATDDYRVYWTVTGTVQSKVRVWVTRNDTGAVVHDGGWVVHGLLYWTVAGMVSDVEHTVRVQVENASGVRSGIGTRLITPSYGAPEVPVVTLTPVSDGGYVQVDVDNPPPMGDRPEVVRNLILRRPAGSADPWEVLGTCDPDGSFRDYTVPGRVPVEYVVRGESA